MTKRLDIGWRLAVLLVSAGAGCSESLVTSDPVGVENPDGAANPDGPTEAPSNPMALDLAGIRAVAIRISGGMPSPVSRTCPVISYGFDFDAKQISWSYCELVDGDSKEYAVNQGSRVVSDAELRAVNMVLANHLSTHVSPTCGVDKADEELTLTFADRSEIYWDDFYAGCQNAATSGKKYVSGIDSLVRELSGISRYVNVPTDFTSARFTVSPMPGEDSTPKAACASYADAEYTLEASTHRLDWSLCREPSLGAAYATVTGARILTEAEYAVVQASLATLVMGASGDCTTVRAPKWLAFDRPAGYLTLDSDAAVCSGDRIGTGPFVIGLDVVIDTIARFAEPRY